MEGRRGGGAQQHKKEWGALSRRGRADLRLATRDAGAAWAARALAGGDACVRVRRRGAGERGGRAAFPP